MIRECDVKAYVIGGIREGNTSVTVEVISPSGDVRRLRMTKKLWEKYGVSTANAVTREIYRDMCADSERCEAVTYVLRTLTGGTYSYKGLSAKMRQKGFSEEAVSDALAVVHRKGIIDEELQSCEMAEKMARGKQRGPARIKAELQKKGYSAEISARAADSVPGKVYSEALRAALMAKCRGGVPTDKAERDKVIASLVRRGFSAGNIIKMMNTSEDD